MRLLYSETSERCSDSARKCFISDRTIFWRYFVLSLCFKQCFLWNGVYL